MELAAFGGGTSFGTVHEALELLGRAQAAGYKKAGSHVKLARGEKQR
jgi:hypothetical protein